MKTFDDLYEEADDIERISLGSPQRVPVISGTARSGEIILYHKQARLDSGASGGGGVAPLTMGKKVATVQINGESPYMSIGAEGHQGFFSIKGGSGKNAFSMNSETGILTIGGGSDAGKIQIQSKYGAAALSFDGKTGKLIVGSGLVPGTLILNHPGDVVGTPAQGTIALSGEKGNITLGGNTKNGSISVRNKNDIETIWIDGDAGDITFRNADFAEEFDICPDALSTVEPGMVMVLGDESGLIPCERAHDSRVAGIIAGAGGYRPGIVMGKTGGDKRLPIAIMGKVYCRVDASPKPIRSGDLLTTSNRRGHAMRAMPGRRSLGAIIGKALASMRSGQGLVPVLVSLQ
jgi:hypothetical protein